MKEKLKEFFFFVLSFLLLLLLLAYTLGWLEAYYSWRHVIIMILLFFLVFIYLLLLLQDLTGADIYFKFKGRRFSTQSPARKEGGREREREREIWNDGAGFCLTDTESIHTYIHTYNILHTYTPMHTHIHAYVYIRAHAHDIWKWTVPVIWNYIS